MNLKMLTTVVVNMSGERIPLGKQFVAVGTGGGRKLPRPLLLVRAAARRRHTSRRLQQIPAAAATKFKQLDGIDQIDAAALRRDRRVARRRALVGQVQRHVHLRRPDLALVLVVILILLLVLDLVVNVVRPTAALGRLGAADLVEEGKG